MQTGERVAAGDRGAAGEGQLQRRGGRVYATSA